MCISRRLGKLLQTNKQFQELPLFLLDVSFHLPSFSQHRNRVDVEIKVGFRLLKIRLTFIQGDGIGLWAGGGGGRDTSVGPCGVGNIQHWNVAMHVWLCLGCTRQQDVGKPSGS